MNNFTPLAIQPQTFGKPLWRPKIVRVLIAYDENTNAIIDYPTGWPGEAYCICRQVLLLRPGDKAIRNATTEVPYWGAMV